MANKTMTAEETLALYEDFKLNAPQIEDYDYESNFAALLRLADMFGIDPQLKSYSEIRTALDSSMDMLCKAFEAIELD